MSLNEKLIQIPAKNITNIFGEYDVHIKKIEKTLGVTVIARDDHLKIIGTEQNTSDAVELFSQLLFLFLLQLNEFWRLCLQQDDMHALPLFRHPPDYHIRIL